MMAIDYDKLLKQSTQKKWNTIKQSRQSDYECNYSEGNKHDLCTHPLWCVLDKDRQVIEKEKSWLRYQIRDLTGSLNGMIKDKENNKQKKDYLSLRLSKATKQYKELREHENMVRKSKNIRVGGL